MSAILAFHHEDMGDAYCRYSTVTPVDWPVPEVGQFITFNDEPGATWVVTRVHHYLDVAGGAACVSITVKRAGRLEPASLFNRRTGK